MEAWGCIVALGLMVGRNFDDTWVASYQTKVAWVVADRISFLGS